MEIQEQFDKIEALRNAYEVECKNSFANSADAIRAFRTWYMSAVEFFCEVLSDEDQLLQRFLSEDVSGNGYSLRDVYPTLLVTYTQLRAKVKKISKQSEMQEITIRGEKDSSVDKIKPKKIFISHSSKDKNFIHALIHLLNTLGFGEDDIFCTSEPGYWIKKGNFFQVIKEQFEKNNLYVIFIQSPRFYASTVSLNEMGAAWVLHSEYYSFLTKDMEYERMNAVVNNHEIACKIDASDAKDRLNDWQKDILKYFGKPAVSNWSIWENHRDEFLRKVRRMKYKKVELKEESHEQQKNEVRLTEKDKRILKEWVDTGDINMYYMYSMDGQSVVLGDREYVFNSGRDEAEWKAFFKRLLALGMVDYVESDTNGPRFQLTEAAFKYFDN